MGIGAGGTHEYTKIAKVPQKQIYQHIISADSRDADALVVSCTDFPVLGIIDQLEKSKRKMYAGSIGYFSANKNFDTCIALRTALIKNKKFYIQSGAGIVADSIPEKEYAETVNKAKALIKSLN